MSSIPVAYGDECIHCSLPDAEINNIPQLGYESTGIVYLNLPKYSVRKVFLRSLCFRESLPFPHNSANSDIKIR